MGYIVSSGIVFSIDKEPYIEIFDVTDYVIDSRTSIYSLSDLDKFDEIEILPDYSVISSQGVMKSENARTSQRIKRLSKFNFVCWFIFPPFSIILLILDRFDLFELTTGRLIVLGALSVSIILPFFSDIKVGNLSLKREKSKEDENG